MCYCFTADKNNSWLRFRYGRLSVDSDDHNFNKKCDMDIDDDDDEIAEYKVDTTCCDEIKSKTENGCLDANGNRVTDKVHNERDDTSECECQGSDIASHQINEDAVKKLQTVALSDLGEFFYFIVLTLQS